MNFIQLKMRYKKKMFQSYYYYSMESKTIVSFMFKKVAVQPFSLAKKLKIYRESQLFYRQRPHSNPKVELYEFF